MKYFTLISYDGKDFYGWAKQPNVRTVEGTLESILEKIFNRKVRVIASGRTDRYVHALELPVTFEIDSSLISEDELINKFNEFKPSDIELLSVTEVENSFSPRFESLSKTYIYKTDLTGKGDDDYYFNYGYSNFDLDKIIEASKYFIGTKDFASFTGKQTYVDYVRTVNSIEFELEDNILTMRINGNGFLRYMVRNIIGALLTHNRGKINDDELIDWINNPEKGKAHYKAKGAGLYQEKVFFKKNYFYEK